MRVRVWVGGSTLVALDAVKGLFDTHPSCSYSTHTLPVHILPLFPDVSPSCPLSPPQTCISFVLAASHDLPLLHSVLLSVCFLEPSGFKKAVAHKVIKLLTSFDGGDIQQSGWDCSE